MRKPKPTLMTKSKTKIEKKAAAIAACRDATGRVTPKAVWQAAKDPANILHGEFEWDIGKAAEQAWEQRARELIREVRVFIQRGDDTKIVVPVYVSDPSTDERAYVESAKIANSTTKSARVLQEEINRIRGAVHRALGLSIAFGLEEEFRKLLDDLVGIEEALLGNSGE